jgi:hypothetical protein
VIRDLCLGLCRATWFALITGAAACGSAPRRKLPPLADQVATGDRDPDKALLAELQTDVLDGYGRDEPPELETEVLPVVGAARIGVGPGDVMVEQEQELSNASSRWPLMIGADTKTSVHSKRLEMHLSTDWSAAWITDEVSWRIELCGRTLVIPLRLTAMYGRDGDRWVLAMEHLSTGAPSPDLGLAPTTGSDRLVGRSIPAAAVSPELAVALTEAMAQVLRSPIPASPLVSIGPEAALIGPQWAQEWRGPDLLSQTLVPGALAIEEGRSGVVGRSVAEATVAYWVGTLVATSVTSVRTRLRATFVFERRADLATGVPEVASVPPGTKAAQRPPAQWVVVQGHVSAPVDDEMLARGTVGSALTGLNPLAAQCPR